LVKIAAASPKMAAFARAIASSSVANVSKLSTGPNISFWTNGTSKASVSNIEGR
jgi:hypothetical protein